MICPSHLSCIHGYVEYRRGTVVLANSPLYRRIYDDITERINSGVYARGVTLPSELKLSQEFQVSQITVRRAMHELELDGLVDRRQGIGTIVRAAPRPVMIGMSSFTSDVATGRLRLVRTLLVDDSVPSAGETAAKLGVQSGSLLRHLSRLDSEGGIPISVDDVYTPVALASSITAEMAASPLFLNLWQAQSGIAADHIDYEVAVEMPDAHLQSLLHIGPNTPILCTGEVIYDVSGRPLHLVASRYRGDRVRLRSSGQVVPDLAAANITLQ